MSRGAWLSVRIWAEEVVQQVLVGFLQPFVHHQLAQSLKLLVIVDTLVVPSFIARLQPNNIADIKFPVVRGAYSRDFETQMV